MRLSKLLPAFTLLATVLMPGAAAATPEMPWNSKYQHVGVATCAGSNCHGGQQAFDDAYVLQNEYLTWQREDAHSNAYKLLLTPEAERMAKNLGIGKAEEARECLTCHSDYVPAERRGRRYSLREGVGCEACHGGAEEWLGPHVTDNTHAENIADGLFPLADPVNRGRLCINCHMGSTDKPIDHRMMGAGHPPLDFELDTFTNIQPPHFQVDADYRERKPYAPAAKTWAIGQLIAAEQFLSGLDSERFRDRGMFPELVFYDCNACHHPMREPRWNAGAGGPLGPGEVRLADAYLLMSGHVLDALAPSLAEDWRGTLNALHRASQDSVGAVRQQARALSALIDRALPTIRDAEIGSNRALALMEALARSGIERDAGDYTAAKQIFYGLEALLAHLRQTGRKPGKDVGSAMDRIFKTVDAESRYDPVAMRAGLRQLRQALSGMQAG